MPLAISDEPTPVTTARRVWSFGAAVFDEAGFVLHVAGRETGLVGKPLEVLLHLLRHAGEVVTKEELMEAVWPGRIISDSNLTKCMSLLRDALVDQEQTIVRTVHGYGYRLVAAVSVKVPDHETPPARFEFKPGQTPPLRPQWQLLQRLGTGGQGEVWLVQHDKTHEQRVFKFAEGGVGLTALKREITLTRVLRESLPQREDFLRPLDWNLETSPYFIEMEYLSAGNLADWYGSQSLTAAPPLAQRLELLAQIAEAITAAHSVGVLHKDLKPGNVLIQEREGRPQIVLADFGSGDILGSGRLEALGITRMGFTQAPADVDNTSGTPLYLAPEVIGGQPFTVQADVYALGVMLYQLVTGDLRKILAPGWEKEVADELLREDIARAAAGNPTDRFADAAQLAQGLRTLKERRRAREHERAVRADAEKHQRAIERYRAQRRWILATAGVLVAGLVSTAALYWQARTERANTEAINHFLNDAVLGSADPYKTPVRELTLRKLLDDSAAKIPESIEQNPAVAVRIHESLGVTYRRLQEMERAIPHLQRARDLYRELDGDDSASQIRLDVVLVNTLLTAGRHQAGCALATALTARLEDRTPPALESQLQIQSSRAMCLRFSGKSKESVPVYRQLLEQINKSPSPDKELRNLTLRGLSGALYESDELDEALSVINQAVATAAREFGEHHVLTAESRAYRGNVQSKRQHYTESDADLQQAYQDLKAWNGPDSPHLSRTQVIMLQNDYPLAKFAEIEAMLPDLLRAAEVSDNLGPAYILVFLQVAAQIFEEQDRCDEALPLIARALKVLAGTVFPAQWYEPRLRATRVLCLIRSGQLANARAEATAALRIFNEGKVRDESYVLFAEVARAQGLLLKAESRPAEALAALTQAVDAAAAEYGADNWITQRVRRERDGMRRNIPHYPGTP